MVPNLSYFIESFYARSDTIAPNHRRQSQDRKDYPVVGDFGITIRDRIKEKYCNVTIDLLRYQPLPRFLHRNTFASI